MEEELRQNLKPTQSASNQSPKQKLPSKSKNNTLHYLKPLLEELSPQEGVFIIVQARTGSTRLKEKVLLPLKNSTILEYLLTKLKNTTGVVLATTNLPEDDRLEQIAKKLGIVCIRGSADDVLSRYVQAIQAVRARVVVRITADCPLHDPNLIVSALKLFNQLDVDYLSNAQTRTYPRGLDIEIFKADLLVALNKNPSLSDSEREHVTFHIVSHPGQYKIASFAQQGRDDSSWRLTVDEPDDYALVCKVVNKLNGDSLNELQEVLDSHPEWKKINQHVQQKQI